MNCVSYSGSCWTPFEETVSAGYEWGKLPFSSLNQSTVTFSWDRKRTSEKLLIERSGDDEDYYGEGNFGSTIVVKDGSGFKNSIGDYVGDIRLHNAPLE